MIYWGREVTVLIDEYKEPGMHQVEFDGGSFASGVYICRMTAVRLSRRIKMY